MIQAYSNANIIRIEKAKNAKSNIISKFSLEYLEKAMNSNLTYSAFKLWCHYNSNRQGYEFGSSAVGAMRSCGFSRASYHNAFKELKEKGFLVETELYKNLTGYVFFEDGQEGQEYYFYDEESKLLEQEIFRAEEENKTNILLQEKEEEEEIREFRAFYDI